MRTSRVVHRDEAALFIHVAEEGRGFVEEEAALLGGYDGRVVGERLGQLVP